MLNEVLEKPCTHFDIGGWFFESLCRETNKQTNKQTPCRCCSLFFCLQRYLLWFPVFGPLVGVSVSKGARRGDANTVFFFFFRLPFFTELAKANTCNRPFFIASKSPPVRSTKNYSTYAIKQHRPQPLCVLMPFFRFCVVFLSP